jgi:hypothetical protein
MTKYFETPIRYNFLLYFLNFRSAFHFCEHTGFVCNLRYVKRMKRQFLMLEKKHIDAKNNLDFELVANIEMGKIKLY